MPIRRRAPLLMSHKRNPTPERKISPITADVHDSPRTRPVKENHTERQHSQEEFYCFLKTCQEGLLAPKMKRVCKRLVVVFPSEFPVVGVDRSGQDSDFIRPLYSPTGSGLLHSLSDEVFTRTLNQSASNRSPRR